MDNKALDEIYSYAVKLRRHLHQYPETGFDLKKTVETVTNELKKADIDYTEKYGRASVVAEIGSGDKILALRADLDALPVEEKTDLPYASKIKGKMHACGHDSHTAIVLGVAKYLKSVEENLNCRVRFIFQPSEECAVSGAKMMVENGVADGVDRIICTHCENSLQSGKLGVCAGDYMAACVPLNIKFFGKSTHAAVGKGGIDAIAMANTAYNRFKEVLPTLANGLPYIWSVGRFSGGTAHNVIADFCEMDISFRFYNMDFAERVKDAVFSICDEISLEFGGKAQINWDMSTGPVINDQATVRDFTNVALQNGLTVENIQRKMSSEDFGWYLTKTKGMLFCFGTRNEASGCTAALHCNNFKIDESGMKSAINAFISYVLYYSSNQ